MRYYSDYHVSRIIMIMPPTPPRLALTKPSLGLRSSLVTSEACGGTQSLLVCKGVTMFAPLHHHLPFCPLGAESDTCPQVSALRIRLLCLLCSRSAVQVPVPPLCPMDKLTPALWTTTRWQLPPYHTITTCHASLIIVSEEEHKFWGKTKTSYAFSLF